MSKVCYTICTNLDKAIHATWKGMHHITRNKLVYYGILAIVLVAAVIKAMIDGGWLWAILVLLSDVIVCTILLLFLWTTDKLVQYCLIKHAPKDGTE